MPSDLSNDDREVIRCPHCNLVQFFSQRIRLCRRPSCRKSLVEENIPEQSSQQVPSPVISPASSLQLSQLIAKNLLRIRKTRHLSQNNLAEKLGVNRSYLTKCESGHILPHIAQLERIAASLQVSILELIANPRNPQIQEFYANPFTAAIMPFIHNLNTEQMMSILAKAKLLTAKGR
jgi:transcriptional regulator with XRE-family HTH domain